MIKDYQRYEVYAAERFVRANWLSAGVDAQIQLKAAQSLADRVCGEYGAPRLRVKMLDTLPSNWAAAYDRIKLELQISPGWCRKSVVLHELAHHLTPSALPKHGAHFASTAVDLVARYMGTEHGGALLSVYGLWGVNTDVTTLQNNAKRTLLRESPLAHRWRLVLECADRQLWEEHEVRDLHVDQGFVWYKQINTGWAYCASLRNVVYAEVIA